MYCMYNVTYCSIEHNQITDPMVATPTVVMAAAVCILVARASQEEVVS